MRAAITGGTGFLGQVLLKRLVPQADEVRVLVRRAESDDLIRSLGAEPIRGDLTAPGGCDRLVQPGDVLFHSASRVNLIGRWEQYRQTTIEGTKRLLGSALPHRPARVVYVSSASVYSQSAADGKAVRADRTPTKPASYNYYSRAKIAAERIVRTECDRAGCPWTIVRLGFLYGPGNVFSLNEFARLTERGRVAIVGSGDNRIAMLYIDDAAEAVILAGTHPDAPGKTYDVANGEPVTQREYLNAMADALDLPRPTNHMPVGVAHASAFLVGIMARITGFEPLFNQATVALMSTDQIVDCTRIRQELGWAPRVSFTEGFRRTRQWCLDHLADSTGGCDRASRHCVRRSA